MFDYSFAPGGSEGFLLSLQHNLDFPHMDFSPVDISPGHTTTISVRPSLFSTTTQAVKR